MEKNTYLRFAQKSRREKHLGKDVLTRVKVKSYLIMATTDRKFLENIIFRQSKRRAPGE